MGIIYLLFELFKSLIRSKLYMLSKSQYLVGLECPKALWLTRNRRDLIEKEDMSAEYRFTVVMRLVKLPNNIMAKVLNQRQNIMR